MFVFALVFLSLSNFSFGNQPEAYQQLTNYREKVYLHVDNAIIAKGEPISFAVYLVNGHTLQPKTESGLVHVDLIDPNDSIVLSKIVRVSSFSVAAKLKLPSKTEAGRYTLRAYTQYMRNFDPSLFYRKSIVVGSAKKRRPKDSDALTKVVLEPEGGYLFVDRLNRVGIRVLNEELHGVSVKGLVYDDLGNQVTKFSTSSYGTGIIDLIPEPGKRYTAQITYSGKAIDHPFPKTVEKGYQLQVNEWEDHYRVAIKNIGAEGITGLVLSAYQRHGLVYSVTISGKKSEGSVKIPKDKLMDGAVQLILTNASGQHLGSRAIYVARNYDSGEAILSLEKVQGDKENGIELLFEEDQGIGEMAFSISSWREEIKNDTGIVPYLLLQADYKDHEGILYHFPEKGNPNQKHHLNALMLSLDATKLVYQEDYGPNSIARELVFAPEKGITIAGRTTGPDWKGVQTKIQLTFKTEQEIGHLETQTDSLGYFVFNDCKFNGTTDMLLTAKSKDARVKSSEVKISIDQYRAPMVMGKDNIMPYSNSKQRYSNPLKIQKVISQNLDQDKIIVLDEVAVAEKRLDEEEEEKRKRRLLYKEPTNHLDFDNVKIFREDDLLTSYLVGRIPGFNTVGNSVRLRGMGSMRGSGTPLFLLNGTPIDVLEIESLNLTVSEIDFIDILKGPRASIYGGRGGNGVVAIYTKTGKYKKKGRATKTNTLSLRHAGYEKEGIQEQISLGGKGSKKAQIQLLTPLVGYKDGQLRALKAKDSIKYYLVLEGLSENGIPFQQRLQIID